jgi:carbon dioxide concentrating mechanism protein CcmN
MRSTLLASTLPNSMTLRALPGQNDETRYFVSGEVQVEAGAGIGAGVLLRANPGCRIHIGRGACIGMGSVLHALWGIPHRGGGSNLGNGGAGDRVGHHRQKRLHRLRNHSAELFGAQPSSHSPGSLLGDPTYGFNLQEADGSKLTPAEPSPAAVEMAPEMSPEPSPPPSSPVANVEKQTRRWQEAAEQTQEKSGSPRTKTRNLNGIPGHWELDRLLSKIYPHRQVLSSGDSRL